MALEVIGAGYGRTGTMSLKLALERLGFVKCYHMQEVFMHPEHIPMWAAAHRGEPVDWAQLYEGYRASVDWPSCNLWQEHAALYPNAKIILSTRDPDIPVLDHATLPRCQPVRQTMDQRFGVGEA